MTARGILEKPELEGNVIRDYPGSGSACDLTVARIGEANGKLRKKLQITSRLQAVECASYYVFCKKTDENKNANLINHSGSKDE